MSAPSSTPRLTSNRHRVVIGLLLLLVAGAGVLRFLLSDSAPSRSTAVREQVVTITLPPPPPPPLPPPPPPREEPPPPKDEPMVEQDPIDPVEEPAEKPVETPPDDAQELLGTNIKGDGPGLSGLGASGSGGGRTIGSGKRGGRWDGYAAGVQSTVTTALRANPATRGSAFSVQVRIWVDAGGRVTRASLAGSTGDAVLDSTLRTQILTGLQLSQPPPAGMPMPISIRISARKPSA